MPDQQAVFKAVQHPIRLKILQYLGNHPQDSSYTDLLPFVEDSTGKLNYHLRTLDGLITKSELGYSLSSSGERVLQWVNSFKSEEAVPTDYSRPEVVIAKIYPTKTLFFKYMLIITIIFLLPFIVSLALLLLVGVFQPAIIIILAYVTTLFSAWKYVQKIWYRITETEVEVFKGLITHSHKIVPFRTITNVELKRGPLDRLLNLSTVEIQTAGNSRNQIGPEEKIVGMVEGEEIKDTILESIRLLNPLDVIQGGKSQQGHLAPGLQELRDELRAINKVLDSDK